MALRDRAHLNTERFDTVDLTVLVAAVTYLAFGALLTVVYLTQITGSPDVITGWRIAVLALFVAVFAVGHRWIGADDHQHTVQFVLFLGGSLLLVEIIHGTTSPGIGFGWSRSLETIGVFLLLLFILVVYPDYRAFDRVQWLFIGLFSVVIGLMFFHTLAASPEVLTSRWPIWACVVAAINLLVIPRFIPERVFLWTIAGLAGLASLAAIAVVAVGEYSLLFFEVQQSTNAQIPFTDTRYAELRTGQSVFNNVNVFGLVAFAGVVSSVIVLARSFTARQIHSAVAAAALLPVVLIGLALSMSEVAWIATGVCVGIYLGYLAFGRLAFPPLIVAAGLLVVGAITAVYLGYIPVHDSRRFQLWQASIEALRASPSVLGHGHVNTDQFIDPYLPADGSTPHNSYLSMFIRIGLLGGLAYVALILGAIVYGTVAYRSVNVGMLVFTVGWAVHQLFESYTLIQWTIPAVLSTLALGYLLFGHRGEPATQRSDARTRDPLPTRIATRLEQRVDHLRRD